jgi:hypothetical protein
MKHVAAIGALPDLAKERRDDGCELLGNLHIARVQLAICKCFAISPRRKWSQMP